VSPTYENGKDEVSSQIARLELLMKYAEISESQLEKQFGIPLAAFETWRNGQVPINQTAAERLIEVFAYLGVFVGVEWLLTGNGTAPALGKDIVNSFAQRNLDSDIFDPKKLNIIAPIQEAQYFCQVNPTGVVYAVSNKKMAPFYNLGDYVGVIPISLEDTDSVLEAHVLLETSSSRADICRLAKESEFNYYIQKFSSQSANFQSKKIKKEEIKKISLIVWHRSIRMFIDASHKIRVRKIV
jgi:hypothetical protein